MPLDVSGSNVDGRVKGVGRGDGREGLGAHNLGYGGAVNSWDERLVVAHSSGQDVGVDGEEGSGNDLCAREPKDDCFS